jgi:two-component system, NtrC family, nitrogen regulation response regulator NtrX
VSRGSILVVDDEKNILATLSRALRVESFDVDVAGSARIALEKVAAKSYDLILLDVMMPDMDGLEMLRLLREKKVAVPVIVMSGHGSIDTAVEATRLGAHDFLEKPVGTERLLLSVERAIDFERLERENRELRERAGTAGDLLGDSEPMKKLREQIRLVAKASAPVLIEGERGTGKELVARAIHEASPRSRGPLEKLNCAAVPSELIESELFGHEAGAFTGATKQRRGKFERAHGGTLFLDEIGDMPSSMQAKLLRVLQEGEIERVGGGAVIRVDVRVVAATNKSLRAEIAQGHFRPDLYDRLNVLPLRMPPLRERLEDVPLLAEHFLRGACEAHDRPGKRLGEGTLRLLRGYEYPGNVRELRNLVERLVILTTGPEVTEAEARALLPLGPDAAGDGARYRPGVPLREMIEDAERELIQKALDHHAGHMTNTAADLGLERSHLYKKLRALGIDRGGSN